MLRVIDQSRLQVHSTTSFSHHGCPGFNYRQRARDNQTRRAGGNEFSVPLYIMWNELEMSRAPVERIPVACSCHRGGLPTERELYGGIYRNFTIGPQIYSEGSVHTITLMREFTVSGMLATPDFPLRKPKFGHSIAKAVRLSFPRYGVAERPL